MRRGEVWVARLNPNQGKEIGKVLPVLEMQADELNAVGGNSVVVLPLTTQVYPSFRRWRISLPARDRLLKDCQIVVDQPRTLDRSRFGEGLLTALAVDEMASVERSLKAVMGMW